MGWLRTSVIAGAALAISGAGAFAEDVTTMPPDSYMPRVAHGNSSRDVFLADWYLRVDVGERWGFTTGVDAPAGFFDPNTESTGKATAFGLGAGFRHNWLRGDVTVDYATKQNYEGTVATSGDVTAKIQTTTALLNIYADLGTWYRLTPYIGAGIGAARVDISDFTSAVSPPFTGAASHAQWNLAWAANAGAALALSRNLQVDIGYRYLSFGNAETADGLGDHLTFKNLGAHEVRVGLRWNLNDLSNDP
jgi:opacity protein-like surface antigen